MADARKRPQVGFKQRKVAFEVWVVKGYKQPHIESVCVLEPSEVRKAITERILRNELSRAIGDLGPQKAAQVVIQVFRLKGLPKELRRHL